MIPQPPLVVRGGDGDLPRAQPPVSRGQRAGAHARDLERHNLLAQQRHNPANRTYEARAALAGPVPALAKVWYYIRETDVENVKKNFDICNRIADGAAMMTDTEVTRRILGASWPRHYNRILAETLQSNIEQIGLPTWTEDDEKFARAVQRAAGGADVGLAKEVAKISTSPFSPGTDDIGDVSWVVPTVQLRYPANMASLPGHHWSNAMAMATPIAHKGIVAGAKVVAATVLDLLLQPDLITETKRYFTEVQTKDRKYEPFIGPDDKPPVDLNETAMAKFRPLMQPFYYDARKYDTYLEQLGVAYPVLERPT